MLQDRVVTGEWRQVHSVTNVPFKGTYTHHGNLGVTVTENQANTYSKAYSWEYALSQGQDGRFSLASGLQVSVKGGLYIKALYSINLV